MFIWKPDTKSKKGNTVLDGFYLILMLPDKPGEEPQEPVHAIVTQVRMKVDTQKMNLFGYLHIAGQHLALKGILGNNGALWVPRSVYYRGTPLPDILIQVIEQGLLNLYHGAWREEVAQWGRGLYLHKVTGICYRCGKNADEETLCPDCVKTLEDGLHQEGMKPPAITLSPIGIESQEKVGA